MSDAEVLSQLWWDVATLIFWIALIIWIAGLVRIAIAVDRWGKKRMRRKRDQEIEMAMRLGLADAEAQRRIAEKILREQGE